MTTKTIFFVQRMPPSAVLKKCNSTYNNDNDNEDNANENNEDKNNKDNNDVNNNDDNNNNIFCATDATERSSKERQLYIK